MLPAYTSSSHPLRIDTLPVGPGGGLLGIAAAPGQLSHHAETISRDLHEDLDAIAAWDAAAVVTLVEPHELEDLGLATLGDELRRRGVAWHHWPIEDYGVPDAAFADAWSGRAAMLLHLLEGGARVLVHCKGGLGRSGTVAARLLVEAGIAPEAAVAAVRAARPGTIETEPQLLWVLTGRIAVPLTTPSSPPRP